MSKKISKEEKQKQLTLGLALVERSFVCITMLIVALILLSIYFMVLNMVMYKRNKNNNPEETEQPEQTTEETEQPEQTTEENNKDNTKEG